MRRLIWPGLAFVATALAGTWAAYDQPAAWGRLALLAAGLALAALAALACRAGSRGRDAVLIIGTLVAALAGVYILSNMRAGFLPSDLDDNPGSALVALALPLAGAAAWHAWAGGRRLVAAAAGLALLVGLAALVVQPTTGAWLGLLLGTLAALLAYRGSRLPRTVWQHLARPRTVWVVIVALVLLLAGHQTVSVLMMRAGQRAFAKIAERTALWRDMSLLVADYPLTGSGPDNTSMVYSSYALLVQVPFMTDPHSLPLQVAIEQGLLGLVALAWAVAAAALALVTPGRKAGAPGEVPNELLRAAALAMLVILVINGVVDGSVYPSVLLPALFVPFGIAAGFRAWAGTGATLRGRPDGFVTKSRMLGAGALLVLVGLLITPAGRAVALVNRGAVLQTKAELRVYRYPTWPSQDAVRNLPQVDLGPAIAQYQAALALDPANVVANRRLGQIELSQGRFADGCRRLANAHLAAPQQAPVSELLGECRAITGDVTGAASLWRSVQRGQDQLVVRERWYQYLGDTQRLDWIGQAIRLSD